MAIFGYLPCGQSLNRKEKNAQFSLCPTTPTNDYPCHIRNFVLNRILSIDHIHAHKDPIEQSKDAQNVKSELFE